MRNQDRIFVEKWQIGDKPEIQLVFDRKEIRIAHYTDVISIKISKEIAEKYLAQLEKTLFDLDRVEDEFREETERRFIDKHRD